MDDLNCISYGFHEDIFKKQSIFSNDDCLKSAPKTKFQLMEKCNLNDLREEDSSLRCLNEYLALDTGGNCSLAGCFRKKTITGLPGSKV